MNHSADIFTDLHHYEKVKQIFNQIAYRYDLANTLMSFGLHNYWRSQLMRRTRVFKGNSALDVCCGTGSITMDLAKLVGSSGRVIGVDFSEKMLTIAEKRFINHPNRPTVKFVQANAEKLPFSDNTFDCVTIGYGLRNVSNLIQVLEELKRVVKPGGVVLSLEMAKPASPIFKNLYRIYLKNWIPFIGKILVHNESAYQYLHDSIQSFPHPDRITQFFNETGFYDTHCIPLSWGIVAIHCAHKNLI